LNPTPDPSPAPDRFRRHPPTAISTAAPDPRAHLAAGARIIGQVANAIGADVVAAALVAAGMDVRRERIGHGFARLTVSDGGQLTEVDLGADAPITALVGLPSHRSRARSRSD
jgi:hypothetical protein